MAHMRLCASLAVYERANGQRPFLAIVSWRPGPD